MVSTSIQRSTPPLRERWKGRRRSANVVVDGSDTPIFAGQPAWGRFLDDLLSAVVSPGKARPPSEGMMYNIDALRKVDTDLSNAARRDRERLKKLENPRVDAVFREGGRWEVGQEETDQQMNRKIGEMSRAELEAWLRTMDEAEERERKRRKSERG